METFENFLSEKCDCHTNNDPAGFENWLEQLDVQELMDWGQEFGEKCFEEGKHFEEKQQGDEMSKIAGVDFSEPLDNLANITGIKLSDMLGKSKPNE